MDNCCATVTPFKLEPAFRPVRLVSEPSPTVTRTSSSRLSPIALRLPHLRRSDAEMAARHQKNPLLTLKFSSNSFLNSNLYDDHVRDPVYVIKTVGASTTIRRSDPWEGLVHTADIQWPRIVPIKGKGKDLASILVQMAGSRWKEAGDILKPANILQAHKFRIPSFSHSLKWKRSGTSYHCTCTMVKGPIATYESSSSCSPPRLKIYETLHDKYDERKMSAHSGVSTHMLDYIITTLLLIVTDVQEWLATNTDDTLSLSAPLNNPTSSSQWRKMIFREPLYPKTSSPTPRPINDSPPDSPKTPTSAEQWDKILCGDPLYPTLRTPSPSISDTASYSTWGPPRPSDNVSFFSSTTSLAPSHTFVDPTYHDRDAPPVPEIPLQYRSPLNTSNISIGRSSLSSKSGRNATPALSPLNPERRRVDPPCPRSQSTPSQTPPPSVPETPAVSQSWQPSHAANSSRNNSILSGKSRRLPKPPQSASPGTSPFEKRASQYLPRSLPPTPLSGPSSSVPGVGVEQTRRQEHLEKEVDELANWVRTLTSEHHITSAREVVFDVPPPAYNDINFSHANGRPPALTH